jgi:hypothetical protein
MGDGVKSWPFLKGKAKNMVVVSDFLAYYVEFLHLDGDIRNLTWAFSRVSTIISNGSDLLTTDERCELFKCCNVCCASWTNLARAAAAAGRSRWQMTIKHNVWHHIILRAVDSGRNPKHFWCYSDESSLRDLKDVASKAHPSLMSLRSLEARYAMLGLGLEKRHRFTNLDGLVDF